MTETQLPTEPAASPAEDSAGTLLHRLRRHWPFCWATVLLAAFLLLLLFTWDDYGVTWDESVHAEYGEMVVDYFASGGQDTRCYTERDLYHYGPFFDALCALIYGKNTAIRYPVRHILAALFGIGTVLGLLAFCWRLKDPVAAFFAPLALLLMPRFYGHAFVNNKDIPFACFFVWSLTAVLAFTATRKPRWQSTLLCGLAIGLCLAVRVGGILLFGYLAAAICFPLLHEAAMTRRYPESPIPWQHAAAALGVLALAWLIMIAPWPWAHQNIITHPWKAFRFSTAFPAMYPVVFEGRNMPNTELPWYYMPKYFLIASPPFLLVMAAVGLVATARRLLERPARSDTNAHCLLFLWIAVPFTSYFILRPNVYDGLRHFLFVLPGMAACAAIGVSTLVAAIRPVKWRRVAFGAALLAALLPIRDCVALHPYEMTYFNRFVGPFAEAAKNYETDYWTTSYKEAMEWVNAQGGLTPTKRTVNVWLSSNSYNCACGAEYAAPHIALRFGVPDVPAPDYVMENLDYYIATTRYRWHKYLPELEVVHTVGRRGAVFTVIKAPVRDGQHAGENTDRQGPSNGEEGAPR